MSVTSTQFNKQWFLSTCWFLWTGETSSGTLPKESFQGDVQMAVSAAIVLGDKLKGCFNETTLESWFLSYIGELLYMSLGWGKEEYIGWLLSVQTDNVHLRTLMLPHWCTPLIEWMFCKGNFMIKKESYDFKKLQGMDWREWNLGVIKCHGHINPASTVHHIMHLLCIYYNQLGSGC